jgi:hypothetical protein
MLPAEDDAEYLFREQVLRTATYDWLLRRVMKRWIPAPNVPPSPTLEALKAADQRLQQNPYMPVNRVWWERAGRHMDRMRVWAEQDGGKLLIVNLPTKHTLTAPEALTSSVFWANWAEQRGTAEDGSPRTLHCEPIEEFRASMPTLLPAMLAHRHRGFISDATGRGQEIDPTLPGTEESVLLMFDVGHYSARGHRLLAEQVMASLREADLP